MTTTEFRDTLYALGLTQAGAASLLGVHHVTVRKWGSGRIHVPPPVERFLRYLVITHTKPSKVVRALDGRSGRDVA
jgi:DNA-binding transcriptional regulator YiaG